MSNQIVISSGAKVRELEGVLTGTSGIVSSVPLGAANGVATLDSGGKVPVSQLPSSVVTYLGTWNAATNTPTLTNGTGDAGDMYICNVAGTVNFGAGPITFAVGDWVLYGSGTWQKSSGQNGTVTSVAASITGNAIGITGSPITTAGTLAFAFAGTSGQYINGAGNLVTFPTIVTEAQRLVTEVYNETGATLTKGTVVYINGGHGNLPTVTKAIATSDATSAQTYGVVQTDITNMNNGYVVVVGSLTDLDTQAYPDGTQLYLSSTTAGAWTSTKQYAPAHLVYVGIVVRSHPTQGVVEVRIQNGFELDELHNVSAQTPSNNDGIFYNSTTSLWESKSIAAALGYTPANQSLVVPYTGATTNVDLGSNTLTASDIYALDFFATGAGAIPGFIWLTPNTNTSIYSSSKNGIGAYTNGYLLNTNDGTNNRQAKLSLASISASASRTYTFPDASGTIALTSDLTGGTVTSVALSAPTGFSVTGSPITTSGTLALAFAAGYSLPTTAKQSNWDDAYTWVAAFPTQTGNSGKFLTTDGSTLSWAANPLGTVTSVGLSSSTSGVTIGSSPITTSGTITIAIATASGSQNGLLSSTDWTTFNNKQNTITDPITGTGTYLYVPRFQSGGTSIGNSNIYDTLFQTLIGTTTISTFMTPRLGVYSGNYTKLEVRADTEPSLVLSTNASGTTPYTEIFNSYGNFAIKQNNTTVTNYVLYYEGTSNYSFLQTNGTQAIRVFSDQNVLLGSGTTNAGYKLDVNGTGRFSDDLKISKTTSNLRLFITNTTATTGRSWYFNSYSNGNLYIGNETAGDIFNFSSTGTSTFSGQVVAPTAYFSTSLTTDYIYTSNEAYYVIPTSGSNFNYLSTTSSILAGTTIDAGGDITASNATSGSTFLYLKGNATTGTVGVRFARASTGAQMGKIDYDFGTDKMIFRAGGNDRMYLSSGGNLGLGTSSPSAASGLGLNKFIDIAGATVPGIVFHSSNGTQECALGTGAEGLSIGAYGAATASNNIINFFTSNSNSSNSITERMRITSSGNVGIGTSTVNSKFIVVDNNEPNASGNITSGTQFAASIASGYASLNVGAYDNGSTIRYGYLRTAFSDSAGTAAEMRFYTGATERMRITSGGTLDIKGNNNNVSGMNALTVRLGSNCNNTSSYLYVGETGGDNKVFIYGNGNIVNVNNSYGTLSDISLKENITDATAKLTDLLQLKVRNFNLIGDETKQIGFIAQEFEEIFPSMVEIDGKSNKKMIKTSVLVPMLVKAIQELKQELDTLKNK